MRKNLIFACSLFLLASPLTSIANQISAAASASPSSLSSEIDIYAKIIAAVFAAISAVFGLPLVFLTYRKTRAEINKLELESESLRTKQFSHSNSIRESDGNIRINIEDSQNVTVQVLADPRFLAPLLLLMDFVFAWVILTAADKLLAVFAIGIIHNCAIAILAVLLLFPIAKQVLRIRSVLSPPRTPDEFQKSFRQARMAAYTSYFVLLISCFLIGLLLLTTSSTSLTTSGRYLAWALLAAGSLLVILIPFLKPRFNKYLESASRASE